MASALFTFDLPDFSTPIDAGFEEVWNTPEDSGIFNNRYVHATTSNARYFARAMGQDRTTNQPTWLKTETFPGSQDGLQFSSAVVGYSPETFKGYGFQLIAQNNGTHRLQIVILRTSLDADTLVQSTNKELIIPQGGSVFIKAFLDGSGGLFGKFWLPGTTEPSGWDITTVDTTYNSGSVGLYSRTRTETTSISEADSRSWKNFIVADTESEVDDPSPVPTGAVRVTQSSTVALSEAASNSRITQESTLALTDRHFPLRITQEAVLLLLGEQEPATKFNFELLQDCPLLSLDDINKFFELVALDVNDRVNRENPLPLLDALRSNFALWTNAGEAVDSADAVTLGQLKKLIAEKNSGV